MDITTKVRTLLATIPNLPLPYRNEVRLEVSEILTHPEYTDPAYSFDQEGPKIYRSDITHSTRRDHRYTGQTLVIRPGGAKDIQVRYYSFDQKGPKIYRSDITHFIRGDQRYTGKTLLIRPGGTIDIQVRHYSFYQGGPKIYR